MTPQHIENYRGYLKAGKLRKDEKSDIDKIFDLAQIALAKDGTAYNRGWAAGMLKAATIAKENKVFSTAGQDIYSEIVIYLKMVMEQCEESRALTPPE